MAILTVDLFNQYSDNYFLSNNAPNNILNGSVRKTLPQTIINTETSLNAMLNGRLYQKYSPSGNIQFKDTTEQNTLYSALTECVLYRIQTGEYINLHNTYSGNVNGTNNFSSGNSNVIGLRNDIRDKLVFLGLYQSGSFTNATLPTIPDNSNNNILTQGMLAKIVKALAPANITFTGNISLPENTIIRAGENIINIYKILNEFMWILSNYTSASGNGTTIPTLQSQMMNTSYSQTFLITISFSTSGIISQQSNILGYDINATVSTSGSQTTLTIFFNAPKNNNEPSVLYLEPQAIIGGWLSGASSCILQPSGTGITNEWNVATSYPTWNYTFSWTNIMNVSFSFVINNATSGTTYGLSLQGYTVLSQTLNFFISNND